MTKKIKRSLSILLTAVMAMGVFCTSAFAAEDFPKADPNIYVEEYYEVTIGHKVDLNAEVQGNGTLYYVSEDPEVATVNEDGIVTGKSVGFTYIDITAGSTQWYNEASARVFLVVTPTGTVILSARSRDDHKATITWLRNRTVDGYVIEYSQNRSFTDSNYKYVHGNRDISETLKRLESGEWYYVRISTCKYVEDGGVYSNWSTPRVVFIR